METNGATFECNMPKIGIRPVIDGRRNHFTGFVVEQTMNMARAAAELFEKNLRYINGQPIKCVIADRCIDGVAEAARTAEKFRRENVGATLSVTSCWCYGSETMDMDRTLPKAIWGINSTERPGAVYLAAALAAHNQMGLPAFQIYGRDVVNPDDEFITPDVREKLLRFGRAAIAVAQMRGKSYLAIGGVSMGIAGSNVNDEFFRCYLGMSNEYADMCEISRRVENGIYDHEEFNRALAWVNAHCQEGADGNSPDLVLDKDHQSDIWKYVVKMAIIIRDMMIGNSRLAEMGYEEEANGHNCLVSGFQGQRQWTDYLPNGDFAEAILSSSFDWNGIRRPYLVATENDSLNGASMLFGHLLTNSAQIFADVRCFWSPEAFERVTGERLTGNAAGGFIHLINSGAAALDGSGRQRKNGSPAMKPFWEITGEEADACLENTVWYPACRDDFRDGGFSSHFRTCGEMPVTMIRLNIVKGLGPVLQLAEGYAVDLPGNAAEIIEERTTPTWPSTWFAPKLTGQGAFRDTYSVMSNWGANHSALAYGHIGADLITLASMLRIPVSMHNVPADRIYRPTAWSCFGPCEDYSTDIMACRNFGGLYT